MVGGVFVVAVWCAALVWDVVGSVVEGHCCIGEEVMMIVVVDDASSAFVSSHCCCCSWCSL